jgi:hypothetical protein
VNGLAAGVIAGRREPISEEPRQAALGRVAVAEARAELLQAASAIFDLQWEPAVHGLEHAETLLRDRSEQLERLNQADVVEYYRRLVPAVQRARSLASQMDSASGAAIAEALHVIDLLRATGTAGPSRVSMPTAVEGATARLLLQEARGDILQARVHAFQMDFGHAEQRLESAKSALDRALQHLRRVTGPQATIDDLSTALTRVTRAQEMARSADLAVNPLLQELARQLESAARGLAE